MEAKCHAGSLLRNLFFTIRIPQQLVIRSAKLGILHRALQLVTLLGLLVYILILRIWTQATTPQLEIVAVWPELPVDPIRAANTDVRHCASPRDYLYTRSDFVYLPEGCRNVSSTEGYAKHGDELLFATYIQENHILGAQGHDCAVGAALCREGLFATMDEGKCECRRTRKFFVHNPEERRVVFRHAFRSDVVDLRPQAMVSVFMRPDGTRCLVGGVSEVRAEAAGGAEEAVGLVSGSLREWLDCAGYSLDDGPVEVGRPLDAQITHLRTMGLRLVFELRYSNTEGEYGSAFVCFITPTVQMIWTNVHEHYRTYGDLNQTQYQHYDRTVYGVMVRFRASGSIRFFSLEGLVNGVVNVLFLLMVPQMLVQFLVTFCLGSLSRVYYHARTTYFDVHEQMRVALARSILPIMAFRALVGGDFTKRAENLPGICRADLKLHMEDIFKEQIDAGTVEDRHINRMVMMLCEDKNGSERDNLDLQNFARICMTNDMISSESMVAMLHYRRKKWALEKLLDDFGGSTTDDARIDQLISVQQGDSWEEHRGQREKLEQDKRAQFLHQHRVEVDKQNQTFAELQQRISSVETSMQETQHSLKLALSRSGSALERTKVAEEIVRTNQVPSGQSNNNAGDTPGVQGRLEEMELKLEMAERLSRSAKEEASQVTLRMEFMAAELQRLEEQRGEKEKKEEGKKEKDTKEDKGSSAPKR